MSHLLANDPGLVVFYGRFSLWVIYALASYAALHDILTRRVPNFISAITLFVVLNIRALHGELWAGMFTAAGLLFLTFIFWRLGTIGGGDAKLLTAVGALFPSWQLLGFVVAVGIFGGLLALLYMVASKMLFYVPIRVKGRGLMARGLNIELWRISHRGSLPYAVAIAAALLFLTKLNPPC